MGVVGRLLGIGTAGAALLAPAALMQMGRSSVWLIRQHAVVCNSAFIMHTQMGCRRRMLSAMWCACIAGRLVHKLTCQPDAGAAGYGAANVQTQANSINGVLEGVSEAGQNAAEGLGALLGSARTGFTSASRAPQPTITHVYHDSRSQSGGTVTVVVVSSSALAAYATLCWWKGWDFFGVSNARLHAALAQVRQGAFRTRDR